VYAVLSPRSWVRQDREWLAGQAVPREYGWSVPAVDAPYPPSVVADELVTHEIVDRSAVARQVAALKAHRTQVTVVDGCYALSNDIAARLSGREGFARLDPTTGRLVRHQQPPMGGAGGGAVGRHTQLVEDEA
jgi:N-acetyl-1-D-myo-inositol-2-amino-2-deoxy-alpha-D-glucopyranoside deacetylase